MIVSSAGVSNAAPVGAGFSLDAGDLRFILKQIKIAQAHAAGGDLFGPGENQVPERRLPFGLRTVDGTFNHLFPNQVKFGAADQVFPRMTTPRFRDAENVPPAFGPPGPSSYTQKKGFVFDSQPRIISNLIVDQTESNPAAVAVAGPDCVTPGETCFIPNVAPDVGLSAPFNPVFTFFGQFFDHGLDLVTKGGGTVFMPLQEDDPLFNPSSPGTNFMVLTRATNQPGPDGITGDNPATPADESADDVQEATNTTTPWVDQNQTYTSHPSHQVFLRQYELNGLGDPVSTGRLIDGAIAGNIGNWAEVKDQAATMLGIQLRDQDVFNIPLLATDPYGRFLPGPSGLPRIVMPGPDGVGIDNPATPADESADNVLVEGNLTTPVSTAGSVKTGHAFLDDISHNAVPDKFDHDGSPATPRVDKTPDADGDISVASDTQPFGTYDDELLNRHFVTGDGRGNENIALTAVHTVFHAEHNRLRDDIDTQIHTLLTPAEIADWESVHAASGWDYGERLFQAARFVTEMQYQHLVFEEFARKMVPAINPFIGDGINFQSEINPAIPAEFAHAVFRLGHSMLTERVARTNADGSDNSVPLLEAFLNPVEFNDGGPAGQLTAAQAAGSVIQGMARDVGNELDEFVTDAVRNTLLGLPLDLPAINIARGRSEGIPPLNEVRSQLFNSSGRPELEPYESWADFSFGIKHRESLVNFVAAYGTHPTITGGTAAKRRAADQIVNGTTLPGPDGILGDDPGTPEDESADNIPAPEDRIDFMNSTGTWESTPTGLGKVDLWVGGLAERQAPFGSLLGTTFNFVFEITLENLQNGDRFYYLERLDGLNLLVQLEGNSFAELIMRNTTAEGLPADVFSRPDLVFNLANLGTSGPITDDPSTPDYDESVLVTRTPNGTIRFAGTEHVLWLGRDTADVDRIRSSEGDDTLRGNGGTDIMEGGSGNDQFVGGLGDDILTDAFGDDVLKGGDGNDTLSSGPGFDLNQGNRGKDFIVSGSDGTETFGGPGDDVIYAGDAEDAAFGDSGDDWIEGGAQLDLLMGDDGNQFQDNADGGHDVLSGGGGDDDYDSDGGDDVMIADSVGTERLEGMLGFDWVTYRGDPEPVDADMSIRVVVAPNLDELRDRFDLAEALSGYRLDDVLRGEDRGAADMAGHTLDAAGIARIAGLSELLGGATTFDGGNIIIGGAGSDLIEGRGGDDTIDGDAWLNVQLQAPDPATADPLDTKLVDSMTQLRADVLAGRINPGDITIVRSIVTGDSAPDDVDTTVFTDPQAEYTVTGNAATGTVTVSHQAGTGIDGTDTLRNIEFLQFADGTVPTAPLLANSPATGTVLISDTTPTEDQLLSATQAFDDPDGVNAATIVFDWQVETAPGAWESAAEGVTFDPGDPEVGLRLRVVATFQDNQGRNEAVTSAPTAPVANINDVPVGQPVISDNTPTVGQALTASTAGIVDDDGLVGVTFNFQWQARSGTAAFANIAGATNATFTPAQAQAGQQLRVEVTFTDNHGTLERRFSPNTQAVVGLTVPGAPTIGTAVAGNASATVNWTAPASDGGSPITEYRIQVRTGTTVVNTINGIAPGATSRVVNGLTNGTAYNFRVRAINAIGNGPFSASSNTVTPSGGATVPSAPIIGTAQAGVAGGAITATANWSPPTNNGGSPITGYRVRAFRFDAAGNVVSTTVSAVQPASARSLQMTLPVAGNYRFSVQAINAVGNSPQSNRSNLVAGR